MYGKLEHEGSNSFLNGCLARFRTVVIIENMNVKWNNMPRTRGGWNNRQPERTSIQSKWNHWSGTSSDDFISSMLSLPAQRFQPVLEPFAPATKPILSPLETPSAPYEDASQAVDDRACEFMETILDLTVETDKLRTRFNLRRASMRSRRRANRSKESSEVILIARIPSICSTDKSNSNQHSQKKHKRANSRTRQSSGRVNAARAANERERSRRSPRE